MEWQPIETAPRDGSEFDAWADGLRQTNARWSDWLNSFTYWDAEARWGEGETIKFNPTHWMPIPTPPVLTNVADEAVEITIIRNAPPPPNKETRGRKTKHPGFSRPRVKYPWDELNVGDAFDVKLRNLPRSDCRHPDYNSLAASMSSRHKYRPERYMARMMGDTHARVWRLS